MVTVPTSQLRVQPDLELAQSVFDELAVNTRVGRGIVRASYGEGENFAHRLVATVATRLALEVKTDSALNLYMTMPGRDRSLPRFMVGSHMDSVPQGGNFDGAAGVVAGLSAIAGLKSQGIVPPRDITVMAIRAEEGAWFNSNYPGSHAAFGKLTAEALAVPRLDTGRTLAEHMAEAGCDVEALRRNEPYLRADLISTFIEVHIEQGPVLVARGIPVGIVTGVRGCLRYIDVTCLGTYAHSGATPREIRHDAVAATVELLHGLENKWTDMESEGADLTFTVGVLGTDPKMAGPSKVSGETHFVLDFRGLDHATMYRASDYAHSIAADIAKRRGVRFEFGEPAYSLPAVMDPSIRRRLNRIAQDLGVPTMELASGGGHDATVFAAAGVPTGMIFIRNDHGSHNPDEAMEMADFGLAVELLATFIARDVA
jgi:N-carbamoyl-L-amino-acid hydrolase